MDLITKMLMYDPNSRIDIAQIKKHPWCQEPVLSQKDLAKGLRLRHAQMEIKRANDPLKKSILQFSERKQNKVLGDMDFDVQDLTFKAHLDQFAPCKFLPEEETTGLLDCYTIKPASHVLIYFAEIVVALNGEVEFNHEEVSMQATLGVVQQPVHQRAPEYMTILIRVFKSQEYKCNIVKFHTLRGDRRIAHKTLRKIVENAKPVLIVPKEMQEQWTLSKSDVEYMEKLFPSEKKQNPNEGELEEDEYDQSASENENEDEN
jgi:hypothetical protein